MQKTSDLVIRQVQALLDFLVSKLLQKQKTATQAGAVVVGRNMRLKLPLKFSEIINQEDRLTRQVICDR